jgi:hypothetical protein
MRSAAQYAKADGKVGRDYNPGVHGFILNVFTGWRTFLLDLRRQGNLSREVLCFPMVFLVI